MWLQDLEKALVILRDEDKQYQNTRYANYVFNRIFPIPNGIVFITSHFTKLCVYFNGKIEETPYD